MARNVEIKARLSAELSAAIAERARARASGHPERLHQTDTFYRVITGRLKLREFGDGTAELIAYERPDLEGPKLSSYVRHPVTDPRSLHLALARTLGIRGVVEKRRQVFHWDQTRIHLDEVTSLGSFLELEVVLREDQSIEAGRQIAVDIMDALGVGSECLVDRAYIDLLERESVSAD